MAQMTPVEIEVAVLAVLDILFEGSPRDAISVLLLAHVRMSQACQGSFDVEEMLLRYTEAFRIGYKQEEAT